MFKYKQIALRVIGLILIAMSILAIFVEPSEGKNPYSSKTILNLTYDFVAPTITSANSQRSPSWHQVAIEGLPLLNEPGQPALPYQTARILLPPQSMVVDIQVTPAEEITWEDPVNPPPSQPQKPLCNVPETVCPVTNPSILEQSSPSPEAYYQYLSTQTLDGYQILLLRLFPVRYTKNNQHLTYTQKLNVTLILETPSLSAATTSQPGAPSRIQGIVDNPEALKNYASIESLDLKAQHTDSLVSPAAPYDYLIITNTTLSPTFQSLINWRTDHGLRARIFTVEEIYAQYDGTRPDSQTDNATRIRNFLIDAHNTWAGTAHPLQYVLLGGDVEIIPVRYVSVRAGIYSRDTLICDTYYAGLDGNWDNDADGLYGEGDAANGGTGSVGEEADLYTEFYVGRAPVSTAAHAANFINKVTTYEADPQAVDLDKGLMLGEQLDTRTYGSYAMDELIALAPALNATRLYDRDVPWYSSTLIPYLNTGPHLVNHLGHANQYYVMNMSCPQVDALNNPSPFLVHTQGCLPAKFDENDAIGEHFVFSEHGAFGFIGNTQYGWYLPGSTNGASQLFHRAFIDALFNEGIQALGAALQDAKEDSTGFIGGAGPERWVALELTLLGDPATPIITHYEDPVAHITQPKAGSATAGQLSIEGSAHAGLTPGATFKSYRLDYGAGLNPSNWTQIGISATTPITNDTLGTWDTGTLADGTYTLRLSAEDGTGLSSKEKFALTVDHTNLTAPSAGTFLGGGRTIPITGTASRGDLQTYDLAFGRGNMPSNWTAIFSGTVPLVDGQLALWDTSPITAADFYTLKLNVHGDTYEGTDSTTVIVDPLYAEGWPQSVTQRISESSLAVGDLDNDGTMEVVAAEGMYNCGGALEGGRCGSYGMRLFVWHHDGIPLEGWPQMPGSDNRLTTPALADLDNDADLEIIVGSIDGRVYVYEHDGTLVSGWPRATAGEIWATPAAGDVDGDGDLEIVTASHDGKTYIWHHNGVPLTAWPQATGACFSSPLLVDLDNNDSPEIITTSRSGRISAFTNAGTLLSGWPITLPTGYMSTYDASPATGDIDGDSSPEIVVAAKDTLYVLKSDGTALEGWPKTGLSGDLASSPALADLDNDGGLEIILAGSAQIIYVWNYDGTLESGWGTAKAPARRSSPVVGDIDGDSSLEILVAGEDQDRQIYAWHSDGSPVAGWPRPIPQCTLPPTTWKRRSSPTLVDLDGDGNTEVGLGVETQIFFWNTDGNPDTLAWPTFQSDMARTGQDLYPSSSVTLTGHVHDLLTGLAIKGATIAVSPGMTASTDQQGTYTMTLRYGLHRTVTAQAPGYIKQILNNQDLISDTHQLDFTLRPLWRTNFPLVHR